MISAIILAAGESRRMGVQNKLLLQIDSEVLIRKFVKSVSNSLVDAVLVVACDGGMVGAPAPTEAVEMDAPTAVPSVLEGR